MGTACVVEGCEKRNQGGGKCRKHGGGYRCQIDGCEKNGLTGS